MDGQFRYVRRHTKVQLYIITCMENDMLTIVHLLESVLNSWALKIYFPKVHNSFTLLALSNVINLNMAGIHQ